MDGYTAVLLAIIFGIGGLIGHVATESSWQTDCAAIGAHVSGQKVYECRVKP